MPLAQFRDLTILVVEDDPDHALLVRLAVRRLFPEIDVRVAGDGREGIAYLAGTPPFQGRQSHPYPDLVILDLTMPEMDGFAVLEWIRAREDSPTLPVVVLTSSVNARDVDRALELGARAFHTKPGDPAELGRIVGEMVERWIE